MVRNLLGQLNPQVQAAVAPFVQRWETYLQKVGGRAEEIMAEGDAGITEIIQMNVQDPGPISAAFSTLAARFRGLSDKVDNAMEKIEEEWEEATGSLDLDDAQQERTLRMMWNRMQKQSGAFNHELEKKNNQLRIRKQADWARALYQLAMQEWNQPRTCPSCGADIQVEIKYQASNVTCPFCKAVNTIEVGMATGLYFQGNGVNALAEEENLQLWTAMFEAEYNYNDLRVRTDQDRQAFLGVVKNYWTSYYTSMQKLHPGFREDIGKAVAAKTAHYDAYERKADRKERSVYGDIVQLVASRDEGKVWQYLQGLSDSDLDMDEAVRAAYEHGDRDGAVMLIRMQHKMEQEDEPIDGYIREKLEYLDEE